MTNAAFTWRNPFATRFIQPGAIPFDWSWIQSAWSSSSDPWQCLTEHWQQLGRRAAIIGPHGQGKSTLLTTWGVWLAERGHQVIRMSLHDGQSRLPRLPRPENHKQPLVLLLDGYEQLGYWSRWRLWSWSRQFQVGFVVTAHRTTSYPTLLKLQANLTVFTKVARYCLRQHPNLPLTDEQLTAVWLQTQGNLREGLFRLYDLAELSRRAIDTAD